MRLSRAPVGILLLFALAAQTTAAPTPVALREPASYLFDTWKLEEGLPQISIFALAQDARGYLWLGTEEGLVRFDGRSFQALDRGTNPELRSHFIQAISADPDGSLWIGTHNGLGHLKEGRLTVYMPADGLVHHEVHTLHLDQRSNLWIGTAGGLSRFDGHRFISVGIEDGLPHVWVHAIEEDNLGTLWLGTEKGLARIENPASDRPTVSQMLDPKIAATSVFALTPDEQGRLWIGTEKGLFTYVEGQFAESIPNGVLSQSTVRALHMDPDGSLWIGTEKGLGRLSLDSESPASLTTYSRADGLSDDWIVSFWQDHEGSLWVGTRFGGLNRLRDASVRTLGVPEGLAHDLVWGVQEDRAGNVWIAANEGLSQVRPDGTVINYSVQDGLPDPATGALYEDRQGRFWVGTFEHGLVRFENGRMKVLDTADGFPPVRVRRILEDSAGRLFFATNGGLFQYTESGFKHWSVQDGLPHEHIRDLYADPTGGLWMATDGGLARFVDGEITTFLSDEDALTEERIKSIYGDGEGVLWLGTWERGLARFENGRLDFISVADGLFHRRIHRILEDDDGRLWMSSNLGIFRVPKSELNDFVAGRVSRVTSVAYGEKDGMRSRECNGGAQPAGLRSRDGRLWFATIAGVAVVDPKQLHPNPMPPPVIVEELRVDQQLIEFGSEARPIRIPPHSRQIAFQSVALSFLAPDQNRFKYKLEGFDDDWVDARGRNTAFYTNLAPGAYRFRVKAANNDGVWNEEGDSIELYLEPAFYQTRYFMFGTLLALLAAIWTFHRFRVQKAHRQGVEQARIELLEAKNTEMEAFTRTVAHDLKTPLFTIEGFISLLSRDLKREKIADLTDYVERIQKAARQMGRLLDTLLELSHSGRIVDEPQQVSMGELAREAVDMTAGMIADKGVCVVVAPDLPEAKGDPNRLLQVYQNLITNAVKFADSEASESQIEVGFRVEGSESDPSRVVYYVRDDGVGIDKHDQEKIFGLFDRLRPESEGSGIGLALVQRIVDAHGGRIWVESEGLGKGSTFFFTLG